MKNKTAMQELLEELEEASKVGNNPFIITTVNSIRDMVEDKLTKEKEQIESAFLEGKFNGGSRFGNEAEQYYKDNYGKEKNNNSRTS